jgi:mitochondrial fission protein ELM1
MNSQVIGLAEAVGLPFEHRTTHLRAPWSWMPGHLSPGVMRLGLARSSDVFEPPWPDLLITCGRRSTAVSIAIRRLSRGQTFTVHIQDPRISPRHFSLVVPPRHDGLSGDQVLETRGALHRVTPQKLSEAAQVQRGRFAYLPRPLIAVLLGGSTRHFRMTPERSTRLGNQLAGLALRYGAGIALTPSRRTAPDTVEAIRKALEGVGHFIWDGQGENPYLALLALADHIVVTGDSVSMVSEAASTGKPVYVANLEGYSKRLMLFHQQLLSEGVIRPFPADLEHWSYTPVNDTPMVAARIRTMMGLR